MCKRLFFFFLNREVILEGKSTKLLNSFSIQYQEHLITKVGLVSRGYPLGLTKSLHTDCSRQDVDSVWVQGSGVCRELHSQTSAVTCLRSSSCPDETNGIIYYPSKCFKIKTCVLAFSSWTRIQIFVGTINRESMGIDIIVYWFTEKGLHRTVKVECVLWDLRVDIACNKKAGIFYVCSHGMWT